MLAGLRELKVLKQTDTTEGSEWGPLETKILELCHAREAGKSICPSEVARALEADEEKWRRLMKPVRVAAARLSEAGLIDILKKGKRIDPAALRGVIRLRLALPGDTANPS